MIPAASALLALRSQGAPIAAASLTDTGFCIAVQCWSFKEFSLFEAIEMAAAAGAAGVELYPGQRLGGPHGDTKMEPGMADGVLADLTKHMEAHGIRAVNFGVTPISKEEAKARPVFELARKLGLYGITTEDEGSIDTIEKLAEEYDVKVAFHNHPKRPLYRLWDPEHVFALVKDRHANVGICADIGHWASSGLDPLAAIRKVAPRVRSFHMKDRASIEEWTHDRPFGTGVIDNVAILDEVRKHGFAGNVSIEYEHNWKTSLPEIAQCAGYLRGYAKSRA